MRKKKFLKFAVIALIILVIIGVVVMKFKHKDAGDEAELSEWMSAQVNIGSIENTISGSGTLIAPSRKEIQSESQGIVDAILVEEGQRVEQGDLLISLDAEMDDMETRSAQLDLKVEEKELAELKEDLRNLKVYASTDGVVSNFDAKLGEEVSGGGVLCSLSDQTTLEAKGSFNISKKVNIEVGDEAEIFISEYMFYKKGIVTSVGYIKGGAGDSGYICNVTAVFKDCGRIEPESEVRLSTTNSTGTFYAIEDSKLQRKDSKSVVLDAGGTLTKSYISNNDVVKEGQLLAEFKNDDLRDRIERQEMKLEQSRIELNKKMKSMDSRCVYAPISGTILKIDVSEGEEINSDKTLLSMADLSDLQINISVDEMDIFNIHEGQAASITASALPGEMFEAEVVKVSEEGKAEGGVSTFDVSVRIIDTGKLKVGMTVNAQIITASKDDVLMIPIEAIQRAEGKNFAILEGQKEAESAEDLTEIEIGMVNESFVEVVKGLNEGDEVFYRTGGEMYGPDMGMMY